MNDNTQADKALLEITKNGLVSFGDLKKVPKVDHSKRIYSAEMKKRYVKLMKEEGIDDEQIIENLLELDEKDEKGELKNLLK